MNIVDEIRAIATREAALDTPYLASRIDAAITALLGEGTGDTLEKLYGRHVVRIGGPRLVDDAEKLRSLGPLAIAAAPELLAILPAGTAFVLVARYWACTDETLVPLDPRERAPSDAAVERFRKDMTTLADHEMFHEWAGQGYAHWKIGVESGVIVLDHWSALAPLEPDERDEILGAIDGRLAGLTDR